jgi:hypothetical protein
LGRFNYSKKGIYYNIISVSLLLSISLVFLIPTFNGADFSSKINYFGDEVESPIKVNTTYDQKPKGNIRDSITWANIYGGAVDDESTSIWADDSYMYTLGNTRSFGEGLSDLIFIKWNRYGNRIWNKTWGGSAEEFGTAVWGDGNYLYTTGYTSSFGSGLNDLFLIKWYSNGTQIWNQTWGGSSNDYGTSVMGEGIYIYTTGYTQSFNSVGFDYY